MGNIEQLKILLEEILGNPNVYFQPPSSIQLQYPCIIFELDNIKNTFADNVPYVQTPRYKVTVIHSDPKSPISIKLSKLPMCRFDRSFPLGNLYHNIFTLYY